MKPTSESSHTTRSSLLSRARLADPEAWRRLTTLYGPLVYRWARQSGMQPDDAADVMQEVFQAVTLNLAKFRPLEGAGSDE